VQGYELNKKTDPTALAVKVELLENENMDLQDEVTKLRAIIASQQIAPAQSEDECVDRVKRTASSVLR
jgi:hypothetical protein